VINQRLGKLWLGDQVEGRLMVTEKIATGLGAASLLARGGTFDELIEHYRKAVAANALRLR